MFNALLFSASFYVARIAAQITFLDLLNQPLPGARELGAYGEDLFLGIPVIKLQELICAAVHALPASQGNGSCPLLPVAIGHVGSHIFPSRHRLILRRALPLSYGGLAFNQRFAAVPPVSPTRRHAPAVWQFCPGNVCCGSSTPAAAPRRMILYTAGMCIR